MADPFDLHFTMPGRREILFTRDFAAPRELVFDCLTKPELVRQWLLGPPGWTMPTCEIDLAVGGRFRYVWRKAAGTEFGMSGIFHQIVRPKQIIHTELFDEDWTGGETMVTTTLTELNGLTTMNLEVVYSTTEARDGALRTGMVEGMTAGYNKLAELMGSMIGRKAEM